MATSNIKVNVETSDKIAQKLESQLGEISSLYEFGEKLYSYENVRGNQRALNEDARRKQVAQGSHFGPTSAHSAAGASFYGLGAMYLYSRVGAKSLFDLSGLRSNIWFSAAVFFFATGFASVAKQQVAAHAEGTAPRVQLHLRVNQNIETHSLLRAMQFHVKTRQMGIWDRYGE